MFRALEKILVAERGRKKASNVGFKMPLMGEMDLGTVQDNCLASNTKGDFLNTRTNSQGSLRYAFFESPLEEDDTVLNKLLKALLQTQNPTPMALKDLLSYQDQGFLNLVITNKLLSELGVPKDSSFNMAISGYVAKLGSMFVATANIEEGLALLLPPPQQVGLYHRVGDMLGVVVFNLSVIRVVQYDMAK
jgi:hypothetical protein